MTPAGPSGGTKGAPGGGTAQGLSTVRNAARLLKVFRSRESDLGVSELARRLGLGKSTVHRILTTLAAEGLIEQNPRTGGYRLGIVMFELGEAVRVHLDLHAAVGQVLGELRAQTGESSQVGVLDGHEVVYVDRLESAHSLRLFTETGRRVPVHCTSSGKVLLAHLPEARRHAVLRAIPLTALTPHTITDRDRFAAELARVRRRGWAEAGNERDAHPRRRRRGGRRDQHRRPAGQVQRDGAAPAGAHDHGGGRGGVPASRRVTRAWARKGSVHTM